MTGDGGGEEREWEVWRDEREWEVWRDEWVRRCECREGKECEV